MEITAVAMTVLSLWLGSIEFRLRGTVDKANKAVSMDEVDERIILRQEVLKEIQVSIKEDMRNLQDKLDNIDILLRTLYTRGS